MIYLGLFFMSFILTFFIKNYAIRKSLLAKVNERSSHSIPTPHGGGIAIVSTWVIGISYLFLTNQIEANLFYALFIGVLISIVSFFDDLYELSPRLRLIVQSVIAICALYILGGLDTISFGIYNITFNFVTNLFAFLMIIWFINLTNFIDGINGYVGSEFVFLGISGVLLFGNPIFIVLFVSTLGFLFWNWNNAKIFMGDVGSTLLGYNIAIITIYYSNIDVLNFWILITLFGSFWFDATITLIRRMINKEKLSIAHKKHAYQRLVQAGWSHFKVTNYLVLINLCIFMFVYFIPNIYISFILTLFILTVCIKFVDSKKRFK